MTRERTNYEQIGQLTLQGNGEEFEGDRFPRTTRPQIGMGTDFDQLLGQQKKMDRLLTDL